MKDTRVQNHLPVPETQTMTGLLSVTVTGTGVQRAGRAVRRAVVQLLRSRARPRPWQFHVDQVMSHSDVVPSPDSWQPAAQAGACTIVPPTDPPSAR